MSSLKLLISLTVLLLATDAAAQCPGGVNDGDLDPLNSCRLCTGTTFEALPARTACGDERRIQCDANGAFRVECVPDASEPDVTTCESNYRWTDCPNGLACDAGFCLQSCASSADCRTNFECQGDVCVAIPGSDMGSPDMDTADMSTTADMGQRSDMSPTRDTGNPTDDSGTGAADNGTDPSPKQRDQGGCGVVASPTMGSWVALWAIAALWMRRRRA